MKKFKVGEIVLSQSGEWFEVKDVRDDGFIAIHDCSGWTYKHPSEFKSLEESSVADMF